MPNTNALGFPAVNEFLQINSRDRGQFPRAKLGQYPLVQCQPVAAQG
jgi:hypothetical protein